MFHSEFRSAYDMMARETTDQGLPYDFGSIMHYPSIAYSSNGRPTFVVLKATRESIGTKCTPTYYDYLHVNLLYCQGTKASDGIEVIHLFILTVINYKQERF